MRLEVLSSGAADATQLEAMLSQASFRKATRAMMLACASIRLALEAQPSLHDILLARPARFGLVLGSAFGELEVTKEFLITLNNTGVARPLLFQNSLHNSTSGFASIQFHFTGPVLTVSHGLFAFEYALEAAELLLNSGQPPKCEFIVATEVETYIPELIDETTHAPNAALDMDQASAQTGPKVDLPKVGTADAARSFVLTTPEVCRREGLKSLGAISDVTCVRTKRHEPLTYGNLCFSGAASSKIFQNSLQPTASRGASAHQIEIAKPGGGQALIDWSPA